MKPKSSSEVNSTDQFDLLSGPSTFNPNEKLKEFLFMAVHDSDLLAVNLHGNMDAIVKQQTAQANQDKFNLMNSAS